jgi:hypothetical protein
MYRSLLLSLFAVLTVATLLRSADGQEKGKGTVVTLDDLKSSVPAEWEKQKPSNNLRQYQFRVPKAGGDPKAAEVVVFFFGKGSGGGVKANLERWKGNFRAPKDKTIDEVAKVQEFKVGSVPVTYLDISGTYLSKFPPFAPNPKITPLPNYRMLGVIFASENGPYFITLIGPAQTVTQHKQGFDDWVKGFK